MKVQLVGKQHMDFTTDDGSKMQGWKICCIDLDTRRDGLEGFLVFNQFLPDGSTGASVVANAKVAQKYEAYFNQRGKLEVLLDAKM